MPQLQVVLGKPMKEWLRYSVCYWHSFRGVGADPFGFGTQVRPWDDGSNSVEARLPAASLSPLPALTAQSQIGADALVTVVLLQSAGSFMAQHVPRKPVALQFTSRSPRVCLPCREAKRSEARLRARVRSVAGCATCQVV